MIKLRKAVLVLAFLGLSTSVEAQRAQPVAVTSPHVHGEGTLPAARAPAGYRAFWGAAIGAGLGAVLGHAACNSCDAPGPVYLMAGVGAAAGLVVALLWPGPQGDGVRRMALPR